MAKISGVFPPLISYRKDSQWSGHFYCNICKMQHIFGLRGVFPHVMNIWLWHSKQMSQVSSVPGGYLSVCGGYQNVFVFAMVFLDGQVRSLHHSDQMSQVRQVPQTLRLRVLYGSFFLLQKLGLSESVSDKVTYRNVLGQLKSNDEENSLGVTSLVVMDNVSRGQRMSWTMSAGLKLLVLGIRSWSPTQHEAGNWNSKFCWSNVLRMIWYPNITSPMH